MSLLTKFSYTEPSFYFKELQVKHLKTLYKCLIGDDLNPETTFTNLNNILQDITTLTKKEIDNLTFLDYFLLLLEIRTTSIGSSLYIQTHDKIDTKIEINLYRFIDTLKNIKNNNILQTDIINNIEIIYKLPTIENLFDFDFISDKLHLFFIEKFIINQTTFDIKNLSTIDKNKIFEQLPIKVTTIIFKKIKAYIKFINEINLLSNVVGLEEKFLPFNFDTQNLTGLIKIFFGEQLMLLYENIFMLCKLGNLTPEYIENCTPGEYILFVKKLDAVLNQNKQTNSYNAVADEFFNPINNDLV